MDSHSRKIALILAAAVVIVFIIVALFASTPNQSLRDAAAVVAMIGAVAVGIERVIESFWTMTGSWLGAYWPMKVINDQVKDFEDGLDAEAFGRIKEELDRLGQTIDPEKSKATLAQLTAVKEDVERLKTQLAPGEQRINLVAVTALQSVSRIEKICPELQSSVAIANQSIVGLADFAATFKDNPGKRIISIFLGSVLGMGVAVVMGLDIFQATLGDRVSFLGLELGVALTGLLMGLGASPTHEVVKILQEVKKNRQEQNSPQPATVAVTGAITQPLYYIPVPMAPTHVRPAGNGDGSRRGGPPDTAPTTLTVESDVEKDRSATGDASNGGSPPPPPVIRTLTTFSLRQQR